MQSSPPLQNALLLLFCHQQKKFTQSNSLDSRAENKMICYRISSNYPELEENSRQQLTEVLAMHRILDVVVLTLFLRHFSKAARRRPKADRAKHLQLFLSCWNSFFFFSLIHKNNCSDRPNPNVWILLNRTRTRTFITELNPNRTFQE